MPKRRLRTKKRPINNLVIIADTHCGCRMGLCCPGDEKVLDENGQPTGVMGHRLDDGGWYMPSEQQLKVWSWWQEFWGSWVPMVCHGEPFAVYFNGDALDGVHHGNKTQISQNYADQLKLAEKILAPVVAACAGRYYHGRGTEAHAGQSAENEEQLAKALGALPDRDGKYARWELRARIGGQEHHPAGLVHVLHHIGTTGSMAYESSAVMKEIEQTFANAARWQHEPPNVVVRSHRHRQIEVRARMANDMYVTGCVTAAWQLKTPLVWRIAGGRITEPQIGGMVVRSGEHDIYTRHWVKDIQKTPPEVLEL